MYTKAFLFAIALLPFTIFGQSYFKKQDFLSAQQDAKQTNKLLFVQVPATDCDRCNTVAEIALKDKNLSKYIQENCLPIKIDVASPEWSLIMETHSLLFNYGTLIFSPAGNLLKMYAGSTTLPETYTNLINAAKKNAKDEAYETLLKEYNNDTTNHQLLYKIIQRRSVTGLSSDSLLDRLTRIVPKDSLRSFSFIQFVLKQYPYIGSAALFIIHKDDDLFKEAWYRMPQGERGLINSRISSRSMGKAIRNKDLPYARALATSRMRSNSNPRRGQEIYMEDVLLYYKGVKDTANFVSTGRSYADQYLMTVTVDSIHRRDSLMIAATLTATRKADTIAYSKDSVRVLTTVRGGATTIYYSVRLNDIAWQIYCTREDDYYLNKALDYAKRAIEINNFTPALIDTYARLLYKIGSKKEAIVWEEKAADLAAKQPELPTTYKKVVKKMKADEIVTAID